MADRTLRRSYNGNGGIAEPVSIADDSDSRSASESIGTGSDNDSQSLRNGAETERESDGAGGIGYVTVDPSNLSDYIRDESARSSNDRNSRRTRKPRSDAGRPRGTRTRKSAEIPTLVTIHNLLNSWGQFLFKELELDAEEKQKLDAALENFAQYHELPLISPKTASTMELLNCLAMVYGPRVFVITNRMKMEARIKKAKKVSPINQVPNVQYEAVQ